MEWVAISFFRGSPWPRDQTQVSCIAGRLHTTESAGKPQGIYFCSVTKLCFNSLWPHGQQHTRLCCPSLSLGVHLSSCPLNQWCHPTISSSVTLFSFYFEFFPASGSLPMSQLFASGGQSIGASESAPVLPMNIQDWNPLGWTGLIFLLSRVLSRVFSSTTVWKHWLFGIQASLQ